jgi:hypothetical protein
VGDGGSVRGFGRVSGRQDVADRIAVVVEQQADPVGQMCDVALERRQVALMEPPATPV